MSIENMSINHSDNFDNNNIALPSQSVILAWLQGGGQGELYPLTLRKGEILNCSRGSYSHDDIIGQRFGSVIRERDPWIVVEKRRADLKRKFSSSESVSESGTLGEEDKKSSNTINENNISKDSKKNNNDTSKISTTIMRGSLILLRATPELITLALEHRTQIIYHADISLILSLLDCKPGDILVESGTGSGSLTSSFADAVKGHNDHGTRGQVYTFDFHAERAMKAKQEFESRGYGSWITPSHGDACAKNAFISAGADSVDSVFLDLPEPWLAIDNCLQVLKENGKVCIFSPCIEQVMKSCEKLRKEGFVEIRTFESLCKAWGVHEVKGGGGVTDDSNTNDGPGLANKEFDPSIDYDEVNANKRGNNTNEKTQNEEPTAKRTKIESEGNIMNGTYRSFQLPMRGHTSYITVAARGLRDEMEQPV